MAWYGYDIIWTQKKKDNQCLEINDVSKIELFIFSLFTPKILGLIPNS